MTSTEYTFAPLDRICQEPRHSPLLQFCVILG